MSRVVVTGFSSVDYTLRLDRTMVPDKTTTISWRPREWPRVGGPPAFIATAMVRDGFADVVPISWVGVDRDSDAFLAAVGGAGVSVEGMARLPGRMPTSVLAYEPDGGCHCLFDPALEAPQRLDDSQAKLVAEAAWVCLTVGPPEVTEQILSLIGPETRLVWSVKVDERVMPGDLAARVAARADVAAWSRGEAAFAARAFSNGAARPDRLLIETHGADGIILRSRAGEERIAVDPIETGDTTGAGDTFLGGFLSAFVADPTDPSAAIRRGARAAQSMLLARLDPGMQGTSSS